MPPPRRRARRRGAALLLALVAAGSRPPLGAHAQRSPPSIWLIGESLWMSTAPEPPPHTAALVLTDVAAGVSELRFMEQFTYGPRECSAWWTDAAHDHEPLELTIREIAYEEEYEESGALRSERFAARGPFTVEAQCTYGLFGSGLAAAPPLLVYYSSAQGGERSYADGYRMHEAQRSRELSITVYHHAAVIAEGGETDVTALTALSHSSRPDGLDQCSLDLTASDPQTVCVLAVVRFRGSLAAEPMTVSTYAAAGRPPLSTIELPAAAQGVVAVLLPAHSSVAPMFLKVSMDEHTAGTTAEGDDYSYKMHVATHTFVLPESEQLDTLLRSQAMVAQLNDISAQTAHAPLQWESCGLQTEVPLLDLVQYSHSPDPIINGSTWESRKTWRSSAAWTIQNLTQIATIYRMQKRGAAAAAAAAASWELFRQNRTELCDRNAEGSRSGGGGSSMPCGIVPGSSFTLVDAQTTPEQYYYAYRAVEHLWADGIFAGCATALYHMDPTGTLPSAGADDGTATTSSGSTSLLLAAGWSIDADASAADVLAAASVASRASAVAQPDVGSSGSPRPASPPDQEEEPEPSLGERITLAHVVLAFAIGAAVGLVVGRRHISQGLSTPRGYSRVETSED